MQIISAGEFLKYYQNLRERTMRVAGIIPPDKINWSYREGKWTLGDILRHLAAIERYMWAENALGKPSRYTGCGRDLADGFEAVIDFMNRTHAESCAIFGAMSEADFQRKCMTPAGTPITTWKWLRALCEHEIHHRGQIYTYLGMLDVATPPLYGRTSEQVAATASDG